MMKLWRYFLFSINHLLKPFFVMKKLCSCALNHWLLSEKGPPTAAVCCYLFPKLSPFLIAEKYLNLNFFPVIKNEGDGSCFYTVERCSLVCLMVNIL